MSLLSAFEHRLERAVDGFFAKVFRSGVHPVEIGKRLMRVMEDGKTPALRRTYVPNGYRIALSVDDHERLAPLEPKLVEELEIFVSEAARQRGWVLADSPRVSFLTDRGLSRGEFRIDAEEVVLSSAKDRSAGRRRRTDDGRSSKGALVVLGEAGPKRTIPIDKTISIGRRADNDLVIPDPGVSRHHAEVAQVPGGYVVRDLGSTNGTEVNGATIDEHRLVEGDRIVVGHTAIEFRGA